MIAATGYHRVERGGNGRNVEGVDSNFTHSEVQVHTYHIKELG